MNVQILKEIYFDPVALELFKNFIQGCITSKTSKKTLRLFKRSKLTLNDIQKDLPVSAVGLYSLTIRYQTKKITPKIIYEYYMGDTHIIDAINKTNNPDFLITKTKKSLQEILKTLKIDIGKITNKAMFLISDVAFLGEIQSFEKNDPHICSVAIDDSFGDFILLNKIVIPPGLSHLKKDDPVLVHLGYIGAKIKKEHFDWIVKLTKKQFEYPEIIDAFKKIHECHESYIDYEEFCKKGKKHCNLTKLQFENYYNK